MIFVDFSSIVLLKFHKNDFADWVVYLHDQPVHVIYTDYRPVPLQHFIYPAGGSGLYEVVNMQVSFVFRLALLPFLKRFSTIIRLCSKIYYSPVFVST